ncbi:MAG TPA: tyrosine-type recombinase/integrase [Acidimicrobiales bacterium]|nr:tyrosine-type recombinase/integrase [Acidimicrobiales bacterium]
MTNLAPLLEAFFTERLVTQRQASPNTIASYRDTICLVLRFVAHHTGKEPSQLVLEDLDAPCIGTFLDHLEAVRGNVVGTRNTRLAAVHSLFRFAAVRHPEHANLIQRVLDIPQKRFDRSLVSFLARDEVAALLDTPDRGSSIGRRDRALLLVAVHTGLRVSELVGLCCQDVVLGTGAHVHCVGKGRKERTTPITKGTAKVLATWLDERAGEPGDPLFPGRQGHHLSRDAVELIVRRHARSASDRCPSLQTKQVTPHVLRHTAAMGLLHAGVDIATIALWLGHESIETTQIYLHADMTIKERALERTAPAGAPLRRYRPSDPLIAFLEAL